MITAVDTSVLLDVFGPDKTFGRSSQAALRDCLREGQVVACEIVWAETASFFPDTDSAGSAFRVLGIDFDPCDETAALATGVAWASYRAQGGSRERVVADFLIGAHAMSRADRLLTRDRGFYRSYYSGLEIIDPSDR